MAQGYRAPSILWTTQKDDNEKEIYNLKPSHSIFQVSRLLRLYSSLKTQLTQDWEQTTGKNIRKKFFNYFLVYLQTFLDKSNQEDLVSERDMEFSASAVEPGTWARILGYL